MIHPSAQIDPAARIGKDVSIGAFCVIGADVEIGDGTVIGPTWSSTAPRASAARTASTPSRRWAATRRTRSSTNESAELIIGDRNLIREFVTFNRGTEDGGGVTRIGNDNWIMAYVHIAHDCIVGNNAVSPTQHHWRDTSPWRTTSSSAASPWFTSSARLARTPSPRWAVLINRDVPPLSSPSPAPMPEPRGINSEGLKRCGFRQRAHPVDQARLPHHPSPGWAG